MFPLMNSGGIKLRPMLRVSCFHGAKIVIQLPVFASSSLVEDQAMALTDGGAGLCVLFGVPTAAEGGT